MTRTLIKFKCLALVLVFGISITAAMAMPCVCASGLDCLHCGKKAMSMPAQTDISNPQDEECCTEPDHTTCDLDNPQPIQDGDIISQHQNSGDDLYALAVTGDCGSIQTFRPPSGVYQEAWADISNAGTPIYLHIQSFLC